MEVDGEVKNDALETADEIETTNKTTDIKPEDDIKVDIENDPKVIEKQEKILQEMSDSEYEPIPKSQLFDGVSS